MPKAGLSLPVVLTEKEIASIIEQPDTTKAIGVRDRAILETLYEDVREVDGVKIPFKVRSVLPQFEFIITTSEVKNNVTVEDAMFAKPKA